VGLAQETARAPPFVGLVDGEEAVSVALGVVGLEEGGVCSAGEDHGYFPGEVVYVFDARVTPEGAWGLVLLREQEGYLLGPFVWLHRPRGRFVPFEVLLLEN